MTAAAVSVRIAGAGRDVDVQVAGSGLYPDSGLIAEAVISAARAAGLDPGAIANQIIQQSQIQRSN